MKGAPAGDEDEAAAKRADFIKRWETPAVAAGN
jgi:hypothetical protein